MKPATCTGSRRGCAFCVEVVRLPNKVSNADARIVVFEVACQVSPSFGFSAFSSVSGFEMLSKLTPVTTVRDGVGRRYETRVVSDLEATKYTSGKFNYRAPLPNPAIASVSGGDDHVLEMTHEEYDTAGNPIKQFHLELSHFDTNGINTNTASSFIRPTVYNWFDGANRLTASGNYGSADDSTNQWKFASLPSRPATAPSTAGGNSSAIWAHGACCRRSASTACGC